MLLSLSHNGIATLYLVFTRVVSKLVSNSAFLIETIVATFYTLPRATRGRRGAFNNYVDQILSNFDPRVGNCGHFTNNVDFLLTTYFRPTYFLSLLVNKVIE